MEGQLSTTASSVSSPLSDNKDTISMHEFLDFLKLTCQVNESLDATASLNTTSDKKVDYNQLAKNELVNSLFQKHNKHSSSSPNISVSQGSVEKKGE